MPPDFNPDLFMQTSVEGKNATQRIPFPVRKYPGVIKEVVVRQSPGVKDPTAVWTFCDLTVTLSVPPELLEQTGRRNSDLRFSFLLDVLTNDKGETIGLDMGKGKNIQLGRLREALGQNTGDAWNFGKLRGAGPLMWQVKHRMEQGVPLDEIDSFTKP